MVLIQDEEGHGLADGTIPHPREEMMTRHATDAASFSPTIQHTCKVVQLVGKLKQ